MHKEWGRLGNNFYKKDWGKMFEEMGKLCGC